MSRFAAFGEREVAVLTEFAKIVEEFLGAKEFASKADSVLQYAMEREKLFRETFEQAAVGVVHTTLTGAVLRANPRACSVLGYSAAELRELSFPKITHSEDLPKNVREFKRVLAGEIDSYAPRAASFVQGSALLVGLSRRSRSSAPPRAARTTSSSSSRIFRPRSTPKRISCGRAMPCRRRW